jgi:hypothetical protein
MLEQKSDHISDQDLIGVTVALSQDLPFFREIFCELSFSFFSFVLAAACANFPSSIEDAPDRPFEQPPVRGASSRLEPESGGLFWTRHFLSFPSSPGGSRNPCGRSARQLDVMTVV